MIQLPLPSQLLRSVVRIGRDEPDTVVEYCQYANHDGSGPGCIIGHALVADFGFTPADLVTLDHQENSAIGVLYVGRPGLARHSIVEARAVEALVGIQESQDAEEPWGLAVADYLSAAL